MNRHVLVCGFLVAATGIAAAQDKPPAKAPGLLPLAVQLEQGIYQEETAGQLEAAAKTYGQIAAQAEATRLLAAQALYRLAIVHQKLKQAAEAQATVRQLLAEYPDQRDLIGKAMVAVPGVEAGPETGSGSRGKTVITAEAKAQAADLVAKGWALMRDNKITDASDTFYQAANLDPTSPAALNGRGWVAVQLSAKDQGARAMAKSMFTDALALDPHYAAALNGLGLCYQNSGNDAAADENWKAAVESDPTATAPMASLAEMNANAGHYDEAVVWYEKWLKIDPDNPDGKFGLKQVRQAQEVFRDVFAAADEFLKQLDGGKYQYPLNGVRIFNALGEAGSPVSQEHVRVVRDGYGKMQTRSIRKVTVYDPPSKGLGGTGRPKPLVSLDLQVNEVKLIIVGYTADFERRTGAREDVTMSKDASGHWYVNQLTIYDTGKGVNPLRAP